jgi:hypothetical protein
MRDGVDQESCMVIQDSRCDSVDGERERNSASISSDCPIGERSIQGKIPFMLSQANYRSSKTMAPNML